MLNSRTSRSVEVRQNNNWQPLLIVAKNHNIITLMAKWSVIGKQNFCLTAPGRVEHLGFLYIIGYQESKGLRKITFIRNRTAKFYYEIKSVKMPFKSSF